MLCKSRLFPDASHDRPFITLLCDHALSVVCVCARMASEKQLRYAHVRPGERTKGVLGTGSKGHCS